MVAVGTIDKRTNYKSAYTLQFTNKSWCRPPSSLIARGRSLISRSAIVLGAVIAPVGLLEFGRCDHWAKVWQGSPAGAQGRRTMGIDTVAAAM